MCEKINSFNFLKSLFLKQRRQKIIYFRCIETKESMITKKKNYPTILIRIWTIIRPQIFFWIVSLTNIGTTERWKIKEKDHFQFSFPPPSPSLFNRGWIPEKNVRGHAIRLREFGEKIPLPEWINGSRERRWRFCCHWNVQERPEDRNSDEHRAVLHGVAWRAR